MRKDDILIQKLRRYEEIWETVEERRGCQQELVAQSESDGAVIVNHLASGFSISEHCFPT